MNKKELKDKLNRARLMEEEMAGALIDLCVSGLLPEDLSETAAKRIEGILLGIKVDTLRHKQTVVRIIEGLS